MADYSFNPQFANLSGLQPLPAIDVTRGANLQFRPLDKIEIQSSRPELVAEGIAGAISNIAKGALGGITARYEKKEEEDERKLKFAHEIAVAEIKAGGDASKERREFISRNVGDARFPEMLKEYDEGVLGAKERLPSGFQPKKDIDNDFVTLTPVDTSSDTYGDPSLSPADATFVPSGTPEQQSKAVGNAVQLPVPDEAAPIQQPSPQEVTTATEGEINIPQPDLSRVSTQGQTLAPEEKPVVVETKVPQKPRSEWTPEERMANAPKIDYTQFPVPELPKVNMFRSEEEANQNQPANVYVRDSFGKLIKNPDYDVKLVDAGQNWKSWGLVDKRSGRISEETGKQQAYFREFDALDKSKLSELQREDKEIANQIKEQKKRDAPLLLSKAAEDNAQMLREVNLILDSVKEEGDEILGITGYGMSIIPGSKSREIRDSWNNLLAKMTLNGLTDLRLANPTGGALGNVSDKDTDLLKNASGNININFGNPETIKTKLIYLKNRLEDVQDRIISDDLWDSKKYKKPPTTWDIEGAYSKQNFTPIQDQAESPAQKQSQASVPAGYVKLISPQNKVVYSPPEKVEALISQRGYTKSE
jgi:hypothetical protein